MAYNVYSIPDCRTVLYHPDVSTANLHQCGHGKITVSAAGNLTSHTMTADGYMAVNRLKSASGTIAIGIPQNSIGDWFLRRWAKWQKNSQNPSRVVLGTLTVQDSADGFSVVCTGVTLQKVPDRVFDRTDKNLVRTLYVIRYTRRSPGRISNLSKARSGFGNSDHRKGASCGCVKSKH